MRNLLLCAFLVFAVTSAFSQENTQKADFTYGSDSPGWTLNQNSGNRIFTTFIAFDKPFQSVPTMLLSITGFDVPLGSSNGIRVKVSTEKISQGGFIIHVETWADSKVNAVMGSWIATGK